MQTGLERCTLIKENYCSDQNPICAYLHNSCSGCNPELASSFKAGKLSVFFSLKSYSYEVEGAMIMPIPSVELDWQFRTFSNLTLKIRKTLKEFKV